MGTALLLQGMVLSAVTAFVDLGALAFAAGLAFMFTTALLLDRGLRRSGDPAQRPADWVTLLRASLVGAITAVVIVASGHRIHIAVFAALAASALLLDGVDGRVARRTDGGSPLGARFDMEVDAFLICVLSVYDATRYGIWVVLIGAARYLLWAAQPAFPWLRRPVPTRNWRKVVAAIQGVVLTIAATQLFPRSFTVVVLGAAAVLLAESFGRDISWLARRHQLAGCTSCRSRSHWPLPADGASSEPARPVDMLLEIRSQEIQCGSPLPSLTSPRRACHRRLLRNQRRVVERGSGSGPALASAHRSNN